MAFTTVWPLPHGSANDSVMPVSRAVWNVGLALAVGVLLTACGSSSCPSAAGTNSGSAVLAPLTGEAATNQARFLEYIRHLPKNAAYETRHFTSLSKGKEQMRYLLLKPKNFQPTQSYPLVLSLHGGAPTKQFEDLLQPYLPGLAYG